MSQHPLSNGAGINKNLSMSNSSYNLSHHELGETAVYFRDAAKGIGLIRDILYVTISYCLSLCIRSELDDI